MCGIAGVIAKASSPLSSQVGRLCREMTLTLAHRGPDGEGLWISPDNAVALGHRRLAVIDLSQAAAQPMVDRCGRYVLTFNGEIYNHVSLRKTLERQGASFCSRSDTEVLLKHLVSRKDTKLALRALDGMFAFALWDSEEKTLLLARDRFGEKPLYYHLGTDSLLFASELRALIPPLRDHLQIDLRALHQLLTYWYIRGDRSIFTQVRRLLPGEYLIYHQPTGRVVERSRYWRIDELAADTSKGVFNTDAIYDEVHGLLEDAIATRMQADVPVGVFLSSGLDSSAIAALARKVSGNPVRCFTIGYDERAMDESTDAAKIATALGCDHSILRVTAADVLGIMSKLSDVFDEPFGDASMIATTLISRAAREHVTVALTGDAGDEVFGGYNRYLWGPRIWTLLRSMPRVLLELFSKSLRHISPTRWDRIYELVAPYSPRAFHAAQPGYKIHKLADICSASSFEDLYHLTIRRLPNAEHLIRGEIVEPEGGPNLGFTSQPELLRMILEDFSTFLPDDNLLRVDRASMAFGLECRVPFLAPDLVRRVVALPANLKIKSGKSKYLLRRVLSNYIPTQLIDLPKRGFGMPLGEWLRGPLRPWVEDLLARDNLLQVDMLNADLIRQIWRDHSSGGFDREYELFPILMFVSWHMRWMSR